MINANSYLLTHIARGTVEAYLREADTSRSIRRSTNPKRTPRPREALMTAFHRLHRSWV
jgi:hypothetical protein